MGAFDGLGKWFKKRVEDTQGVYHQANPFDNGRTFSTNSRGIKPTNFQDKSIASQAGGIAKGVISQPTKLANTYKAAYGGLYGLGKIQAASLFGDKADVQRVASGVSDTLNRDLSPNSGLFGLGTMVKNRQEAQNLTTKQLLGKSLNTGSQTASLVLPTVPIKGFGAVGSRIANNALQGGVGSALSQQVENGKVNWGQVGKDTATAAALGEAIPAAQAVNKRIPRIAYRSGLPNEAPAYIAKSKEMASKYNDRPGSQMQRFTYKPKDVLDVTTPQGRALLDKAFGAANVKKMTNTRSGLIDPQYDGMVKQVALNNGYKIVALDEAVGTMPKRTKLPKDTRTFSVADTKSVKRAEFGSNPAPLGMGIKQTVRDPYIQEYADLLRDIGEGNGVDVMPDGTRKTNNYRLPHLKGKRMTKADWYDEALRQVENGTADKDFMNYYQEMQSTQQPKNIKLKDVPTEKAAFTLKETKAGDKLKVRVNQEGTALESFVDPAKRMQELDQLNTITPSVGAKPIEPGSVSKSVVKDFEDTLNKRLGSRAAGETSAVATVRSLPKLDTNASMSFIDNLERGMETGDFGNISGQVREILDNAHQQLTASGKDIGYRENYFPHQWANPDQVAKDYQAVKLRAGIQNERIFPTMQEGIKLGFKPATTDYRQALARYLNTAEQLMADTSFFKELKGKGLIVEGTADSVGRGYVAVQAPGLPQPAPHFDPATGTQIQGAYFATPEIAAKLNKVFGDNSPQGAFEKTLDKTAKAASLVQDFGLSSGVPLTGINSFTVAQDLKSALSGNIKAPIVAHMNALSKEGFNKYMDANAQYVKDLQGQGVRISSDYSLNGLKSLSDQLADASGVTGKTKTVLSTAWSRAMNDPTFKRHMPTLQIEMFKKVYNKQVGKLGPEQASKVAADSVKNFFGLRSMAKEATSSRVANDLATTVLFAPKYRGAMVRFWKDTAASLLPQNITKPEYRNNLKFAAGAAMSFAALDYLNQQAQGVHIWDNPDGKKDKALIPASMLENIGIDTGGKDVGIPFLSSIATVPRYAASAIGNTIAGNTDQAAKDAAGFLGYGVRPLADAFVTNENYFGSPIVKEGSTPSEAAKARGQYIFEQFNHPYIRETMRSAQGKNASTAETLSRGAELPFRFYDSKYYKYNNQWAPRGKQGEKFTIAEQRERAALNGQIKNVANDLGLSDSQKAKFTALTKIDYNDKGEPVFGNNPFYKAQRATALQDDGVFEAAKQQALLKNKLNGQPVDPLYGLSPNQRRVILWKETLPAGTSDPTVKQLYDQAWYQEFQGERSRYYDDKQQYNKSMGYKQVAQKDTNPFPTATPQMQAKLDAYYQLPSGTGQRSAFLRQNPDILAYWDKKDAWTNGERAQVGLGPIEDKDAKYAASKGRGGKQRAVKISPLSGDALSPVVKLASSKPPKVSVKKPGIKVRARKGKIALKAQKPAKIKG